MSIELVMYRGDDRDFTFTLTEDDTPIDLSTASIVFSGRKDIDDVEPTLYLTSTAGDIVPDVDQVTNPGVLVLTIPASATTALERNTTLLCDFEVTRAGKVRTWPDALYGDSTLIRLRIRGDVTHA